MTDYNILESIIADKYELCIDTPVKEEVDLNMKEATDFLDEIKTEPNTEVTVRKDIDISDSIAVKEEVSMDFEGDSGDADLRSKSIEVTSASHISIEISKTEYIENENTEVKEEMVMSQESLVSYDYPNFDDVGSIDSNDVAVLGSVETCLQEDMDIKSETQAGFEEHIYDEFNKELVKEESEMITETQLISNKLINTTSTVTNPQDGLIESQTTKTLVMEILPIRSTAPIDKMANPEEILPTTYDDIEYDNTFQLNSITGNVLSLEQEAYSLLKAKKDVVCKKNYSCSKCSKECRDSSAFRRHMNVHRSIEKRAMGVIRGQQTRKENRRKRLKDEYEVKIDVNTIKQEVKQEIKEGYECTCGKVFQRKSRMETCMRSHDTFYDTNAWHQCATCLKQFKNKEDLAAHRKRSHTKKFQCKFCPTDYPSRKELFKHLQLHQKVQLMEYKVITEVVEGKQKLRCFMCANSFSELSDLKSHVMDDHKSPYVCINCEGTFSRIIEFCNHMKTNHPDVEGQSVLDVLEAFSMLVKAWKCEECGLQFYEADKLALHHIEKHSPDIKADPQFQCPDCRRVFISQKGLTSHRRVHHSEQIEETETAEKGVMCLECRKICKDMDALTSHMRLHSPERKYPCKFCDFRFATPEKRKAHAEIHTGDLKYVCFICEYQCSSENRLTKHKQSVKHISMKEYLLTGKPHIEEQSTSKSKAKKRKEDKKKDYEASGNETESDKVVPCDVCGESFASEELMLEHKQTHPFIEFPNDDKPTRIFFK